jgi:hypothetical protein
MICFKLDFPFLKILLLAGGQNDNINLTGIILKLIPGVIGPLIFK